MSWEGVEKRRFPRAKFPCKVKILLPQERTLVTSTENIGMGGVRVILDENLVLFSIVGLEIFIEDAHPVRCKGKVVWGIEVINPLIGRESKFDIGMEFLDITPYDQERIKRVVEKLIKEQ